MITIDLGIKEAMAIIDAVSLMKETDPNYSNEESCPWCRISETPSVSILHEPYCPTNAIYALGEEVKRKIEPLWQK